MCDIYVGRIFFEDMADSVSTIYVTLIGGVCGTRVQSSIRLKWSLQIHLVTYEWFLINLMGYGLWNYNVIVAADSNCPKGDAVRRKRKR